MTYLFEPLPDGGWVATSPECQGVVASAATVPATLAIAESVALELARARVTREYLGLRPVTASDCVGGRLLPRWMRPLAARLTPPADGCM